MLTEAEAKKKWCPFIRFTVSGDRMYAFNNRINSPDDFADFAKAEDRKVKDASRCIASDCMAWRTVGLIRNVVEKPEGEGWVIVESRKDIHGQNFVTWRREVGYCGFIQLAPQ